MLTSSLTQFIRRIGICALSLAVGVSAAIALLLLVSDPPAPAQAANSPHPAPSTARAESLPTGASAEWWAAVQEQLNQDPANVSASLNSSAALTLTGPMSSSFGFLATTAGDVNGDGFSDVIIGAYGALSNTGKAFLYLGSANGLSIAPAVTLTGEAENNHFGLAAGTAGDVNGDGYADVIVGAPVYSPSISYTFGGLGRAYLYLGGAAGLNATPVLTLTGSSPLGDFGYPVGTAGDVNGDDYSDVIVGAHGAVSGTGQAYIYLGGPDGLSASPAVTLTGETTSSLFGFAASTAGDVNGDGYGDVIVGAWDYPTTTVLTGRAYVYLGSASGLSSTPIFTVTGENAHDYLGWSVGTAGDVNGDGYADIVVGASGYLTGAGRVYIYAGGPGGINATPIFTATGETSGDSLGDRAVGTAGDVNGDGYADVILGALGYNGSMGRAYVYLGSAQGLTASRVLTFTGEAMNNRFGNSVATAGDVNGDGYSDILIGAPGYNSGTGRAYVYHGAADAPGSTPTFIATGEASNNRFGFSVATAGDVNGDSYADVIVGADTYGSNTGRAYVYLGSATGLSTTPAFTATGEAPNNQFGISVGTAGDVNGDGYADVIIGTHGADRAYLYLGSVSGLSATPAFTLTGESPSAFGFAVGTAGDVNGDGYADVIVGAHTYSSTGRVYVYLGSATGLSTTPAFTVTGEETGNDTFGFSVGTAGDVNRDGYADVIIGAPGYISNTGRAYVYLGSANGLSAIPAFTATGELNGDLFGLSVKTAGDVNSDGYSDVIIGAYGYPGGYTVLAPPCSTGCQGRAYVYLGGVDGLSATPVFTATGEPTNNRFGASAGTAGDVNGDGYADVIIGAWGYVTQTGQVYVYLGSATGLNAIPAFTVTGETPGTFFGKSIGTAGDVNGDGYADMIVGAERYNSSQGRVYVYPGNGGYSLSLAPQQRRADNSAPIATVGRSDSESEFRLAALGRSPFGRGKVKLEWEVKPLGTPFNGIGTQQSSSWLDSGTAGAALNELITGLNAGTLYHWRMRILYHPASTPFQQYSRWVTQPWNGWQEADLRTAGTANAPPIAADDAYTVTEDLPLTVAAPGVLANDTDADGPAALTAITVTNPPTGSLAFNSDGSFTYTPLIGFTGVVTFTYRANDGLANSNLATVTITVTAAPGSKLYLPLITK